MNRCEGLPNWTCGRPTTGREQHCFVHGDAEDREARWAMSGLTKVDVDPLIGATRSTRIADLIPKPNEAQMRLINDALEGKHEEDDRNKPQKPDVTRPPEKRKGNTRRGDARKHRDTMSPSEVRKWKKAMA